AKVVMPMAVSPDKRILYAASRSKPYSVHAYAIDAGSGALKLIATSPLAESFPYISLDRTGRVLFGASYGGNLVSVNAIGGGRRGLPPPPPGVPAAPHPPPLPLRNHKRVFLLPPPAPRPSFGFVGREAGGGPPPNPPAAAPDEGRHRPPPPDRVMGQPLRLSALGARRDRHHAVARSEDGAALRGQLGFRA